MEVDGDFEIDGDFVHMMYIDHLNDVIEETSSFLSGYERSILSYEQELYRIYPPTMGMEYGMPEARLINIALSMLERAYFWLGHSMRTHWQHGTDFDWSHIWSLTRNSRFISNCNRRLPAPIRHEDRRLAMPCYFGAEARAFRKRILDQDRVDRVFATQVEGVQRYSLRWTRVRLAGPGYFFEDTGSEKTCSGREEDAPSETSRKRRRC